MVDQSTYLCCSPSRHFIVRKLWSFRTLQLIYWQAVVPLPVLHVVRSLWPRWIPTGCYVDRSYPTTVHTLLHCISRVLLQDASWILEGPCSYYTVYRYMRPWLSLSYNQALDRSYPAWSKETVQALLQIQPWCNDWTCRCMLGRQIDASWTINASCDTRPVNDMRPEFQ